MRRRQCLLCKANATPAIVRLPKGVENLITAKIVGRRPRFTKGNLLCPIHHSIWPHMALRAPFMRRLELAVTGALELTTRPKALPFPHQTLL